MRCVARLVAPGAVGLAHGFVDGLGTAAGPADAVGVVEAALGGVAEEVIRSDDEAVAFYASRGGDVVEFGCVGVLVGVVELDELVEAGFGVGGVFVHGEDLVGGRVARFGPLGNWGVWRAIEAAVVVYRGISTGGVVWCSG